MRKMILIPILTILLIGFLAAEEYRYSTTDEISLQEALYTLKDGDTLYIEQGIYVAEESLYLEAVAEVNIVGQGEVWLLCRDIYSDVFVVSNCRDVYIEGLKMRHEDPPENYECNGSVLYADSCHQLNIIDCELNGCGAVGIRASECGTVNVMHCYINNNSWTALYLYNVAELHLIGSTITQNNAFLNGYEIGEIMMEDNIISGNTSEPFYY